MNKKQARTKGFSPRLSGAILGAIAGEVAYSVLRCICVLGLMGSGHGGPLEETDLESVAWILVFPGPVLGAKPGLATLGWIVSAALPFGVFGAIGAFIGVWVAGRKLAKSDRARADPGPVSASELYIEAPADTAGINHDPEVLDRALAELEELGLAELHEGDDDYRSEVDYELSQV